MPEPMNWLIRLLTNYNLLLPSKYANLTIMKASFVGHTVQRNVLQQQIASSKSAGAYLIYGPTGLGKNYLATNVIEELFCQVGEGACGQCSDCRWLAQNSHPDIYRLRSDDSLSVDVARAINEFAHTSAVGASGHKCIVIERADTMTTEAGNALLKLLEEPPKGVIFFLLAERSKSVLATVRSRCQLIKLLPLSETDMRQLLAEYNLPPVELSLILGLSLGRPGRAMTLARGQLAEYQLLIPELMSWLRGDLTASFRALKAWLDTTIKAQDTVEQKLQLMNSRLNYLELLLRDVVFFQVQSDYVVNQARLVELQAVSQRYTVNGLMALLQRVSHLRAQLATRSSNQQLSWENFILSIKQLAQTSSL